MPVKVQGPISWLSYMDDYVVEIDPRPVPITKQTTLRYFFPACKMLDFNGSQRTWVIGLLCVANAAYLFSSWRGGEIRTWQPWALFDFELPKVICFSPAEMARPVGQLLSSLAIIASICATCQQARLFVDRHVSDNLVRCLVLETIAAADLCGCCFELIIGKTV